jgi:hypothetical protein
MDIFEDADRQAQFHLDAAIYNISNNANVSIEGSGECLYCGEAVEPTVVNGKSIVGRWCSAFCRDMYND